MATTKFPEMKWCFAPIKNHLLVIYYPLSVSQSAHFHQSVSTHTLIQFNSLTKSQNPKLAPKTATASLSLCGLSFPHFAWSIAWVMSAMMSSIVSMPTLNLTRPGGIPAEACCSGLS